VIASRCGESFRALRIQQANASRHDFDHTVAFELGEGPADRFNGEAEVISDVLTAHRQRHRLCRALELSQSIAPANQESRDFFLGGTAPEQNHMILSLIQFANRQLIDAAQEMRFILDEPCERSP
jgi:hypothetical protein